MVLKSNPAGKPSANSKNLSADARIFVAGHNGMVGAAVPVLQRLGAVAGHAHITGLVDRCFGTEPEDLLCVPAAVHVLGAVAVAGRTAHLPGRLEGLDPAVHGGLERPSEILVAGRAVGVVRRGRAKRQRPSDQQGGGENQGWGPPSFDASIHD